MRIVEDEITERKRSRSKNCRSNRHAGGRARPCERNKKARASRSDVKRVVLSLLDEFRAEGLVATSAVEAAGKRGIHLERATVSSLLSRLKHDGAVTYDGKVSN